MNNVIIIIGLPSSGKTTLAKKYVKLGYVRISADDIAKELGVDRYENKRMIADMRDALIDLALLHKKNVVVDDCNDMLKHVNRIIRIADMNEASYEIKKTDMPIERCIKLDAQKDNPVGEKTIREIAERINAQ